MAHKPLEAGADDEDLKDAIAELESEFGSLNNKYQSLLTGMTSGEGDSTQHTRDLVSVIESMHIKGDKLRALRSPAQMSTRG
jgi:hypothetical protein